MSQDAALVGFMAGAICVGYLAVSLFFLRFWRRTRDGLFLAFALAFVLLAINQAIPALAHIPSENLSGVYLLRLAAFLVIIAAILHKNLHGR